MEEEKGKRIAEGKKVSKKAAKKPEDLSNGLLLHCSVEETEL